MPYSSQSNLRLMPFSSTANSSQHCVRPFYNVCIRHSVFPFSTSIVVSRFLSLACYDHGRCFEPFLWRNVLQYCRRWWVPSTFFEGLLIRSVWSLRRASALLSCSWRSYRRLPNSSGGSREVQGLWFLLQSSILARRVRWTPVEGVDIGGC